MEIREGEEKKKSYGIDILATDIYCLVGPFGRDRYMDIYHGHYSTQGTHGNTLKHS